ncbi:hypothetical protein [Streptomyces sp. NPDC057909]|uniref:hypothetical protein n=1 Tax=Streptomyces sp. NPDC057909 TaxID=3346277 RepID=UPI0036EE9F3A
MTITAGTGHSPEAEARAEAGTHHATAVPPAGRPGSQPREGQRPGRPRSNALKKRLRRHWATLPARLRLIRAAILLLTAALALLLLLAGLAVSATWDTVTGRDAPRTTSAAGLDLALNDMDAQAANILLSSGDAGADRMDVPYGKAVRFYGAARRTVSRELRTLAVAAEGDARAEHTVEALTENYQRDDRTIRRLVAEGKEREAVAFCISWDKNKSNAHFGAWMDALDEVTEINRTHFATSVREGRGAVAGLLPAAGGALMAAAALTVLSLRPRLVEFRG